MAITNVKPGWLQRSIKAAQEEQVLQATSQIMGKAPSIPYIGVDLGSGRDVAMFRGIKVPANTYVDQAQNELVMGYDVRVSLNARDEEIEAAARKVEEIIEERERLPHEFLAFCRAQFPDLIECFKRYKLVKKQFAKFAGQAKED